MYSFLVVYGFVFYKGYKYSTINIVDIYLMMCYILGLKLYFNNGIFGYIKCLLVD